MTRKIKIKLYYASIIIDKFNDGKVYLNWDYCNLLRFYIPKEIIIEQIDKLFKYLEFDVHKKGVHDD